MLHLRGVPCNPCSMSILSSVVATKLASVTAVMGTIKSRVPFAQLCSSRHMCDAMHKEQAGFASVASARRKISHTRIPLHALCTHSLSMVVVRTPGIGRSEMRRASSGAGIGEDGKEPVKSQEDIKRLSWMTKENDLGKGRWNWLLRMLGFYTTESKMIRSSAMLYLAARKQAGRKEFALNLGLGEDFTTRFYLECLHVWMVLVRLRKEGKDTADVKQDFFDRFWDDVTAQIHQMGIKPIALNTRVRELQNAFYGCAVAYDYSLGTSDALLASALYRNLYNHESKASNLVLMTAYVRRELDALDKLPLDKFLECDWKFGSPNDPH